MEPGDDHLGLPDCLQELADLDEPVEQSLLERILADGWDLGAVFSLDADLEPPPVSPASIRTLHEALQSRPGLYPQGEDRFESQPPEKTAHPDGPSTFVVLNQRCDLIKGIAKEPLVMVAPASPISDQSLAAGIANRTSSTHVFLGRDSSQRIWGADIRMAGYIPKTWLGRCKPYFPLAKGSERRRLAHEVGNRFSRPPVPTPVVRQFQDPVKELYRSQEFRELSEPFAEFVLLDDDGQWQFLALYDEGEDADRATEKFDAMMKLITEATSEFPLDLEGSDAVHIDDLSASDYLAAIRLDMTRVTYGQKSDHAAHAEPSSWQ